MQCVRAGSLIYVNLCLLGPYLALSFSIVIRHYIRAASMRASQ